MDAVRSIENLALVGFMGVGKSSVAHYLAAQLRFKAVDTDHLIEEKAGRTVSAIFAEFGESTFRELEAQVVQELESRRELVIATGGGMITREENLKSLRSHSLVVCLWAGPETLYERVRHQSHRPLLQTEDPLGRIRELLAEREADYRKADVLLSTEHRSPREVAQHIRAHWQMHRRDSARR